MTTAGEEIIQAVADDLDANADLDSHTTVRFRRPRAVMPEDCPLLCVWLQEKTPEFITTERFDTSLIIGVSWQEESVQEAQTLINEESLSLSLLTNIDKIEKRLRYLSTNGWPIPVSGTLDNAWQLLPGGTEYQRLQDGLIEGYTTTAVVNITEED